MPDLKISQLPVATTPLAGTELVPIVQGGVTDRTTVAAFLSAGLPVSATTLSASGAVTLSGGTANGVLYLNGSKVATSGTALAFNGTSTFELSINQNASTIISTSNTTSGTAAYAAYKLASDTNTWLYNFSSGYTTSGRFAAGTTLLDANGTGGLSLNAQNGPISFWLSTEQMRLTSTGLGIGTISPASRLHVVGSGNPTITLAGSDGAYTSILSMVAAGGGSSVINANGGQNTLLLQTNSTTRATLDSSGNLIQTAPTTPPTLSTNGTMVFNLTSDTNLRVSVRGSDGVTRVANLTLA